MLAAFLTKDGFSLREERQPEIGDNQLLIQTLGCGICGGDQHTYKVRKEAVTDGELFLGHEGTGTVVAIGGDVSGFSEGDLVTSLGGGFADYFVANAEELVKVPDNVDPLLALGEPVACCVHAVDRIRICPGDKVAILGCGFMGLVCLQLAKIAGAGEIVALDPMPYRREMALELGASTACAPSDYKMPDPDIGEFDVVIEAAGNQPVIDDATDMVKQHGKVVLVGYHESFDGMRQINMKRWNFKAIDVLNGHVRRDDEKLSAMRKGMQLLSSGQLQLDKLVALYPLTNIEQAFSDIFEAEKEVFKIVLQPTPSN